MWQAINPEDLDSFTQRYPQLKDYPELFLQETKHGWIVPRHLSKYYPHPALRSYSEDDWEPKTTNMEFTTTLREYQKNPMEGILTKYNKQGSISGLIEGRPGSGKTVCSAYLSCATKLKTIILLDNSQLMQQWKEAYTNFTSCSEDDIGIIQGRRFDTDKPVTIAMVQTLMSASKDPEKQKKLYLMIKQEGYALAIFDEAHKSSCAPKYALSSLFLNTPNIIGLTATPPHNGAHEILIKSIIGENIALMKDYEQVPTYTFISYTSGLTPKQKQRVNSAFNFSKQPYIGLISSYNSVVADDTIWLDLIVRSSRYLVESGHKTIIITSTVKQVENITAACQAKVQGVSQFYSQKRTFNRDTTNVLVATQKYASAGFDWKDLSALIIACPLKGKTSLIQTIGRILRLLEGKKDPIVYDLIDLAMGGHFANTIDSKINIITEEFPGVKFKKYHQTS